MAYEIIKELWRCLQEEKNKDAIQVPIGKKAINYNAVNEVAIQMFGKKYIDLTEEEIKIVNEEVYGTNELTNFDLAKEKFETYCPFNRGQQ